MKKQIPKLRLESQQLTARDFHSVKDLVGWMGAMQAQDYGMSKWGIGLRIPGATNEEVERAIDQGEIIRTHILRPTWHFVEAKDVRWMMNLTAPEVLKVAASGFKQLELDQKIFKKTKAILEKILVKGTHLIRSEIAAHFERGGIRLSNLQLAHILLRAELDMVVCNGSKRGKQFTYALFDERIPLTKSIDRDEALAKLARIYFSSHGPATLRDFVWWSGLLSKDAKIGLAIIQPELQTFSTGSKEYWFKEGGESGSRRSSVFLLPAFDEYTIAYTDRSDVLSAELSKTAMTTNGIFNPIVVVNGKVVGIWKRQEKGNIIIVKPVVDKDLSGATKLATAVKAYGKFWGREAVLSG